MLQMSAKNADGKHDSKAAVHKKRKASADAVTSVSKDASICNIPDCTQPADVGVGMCEDHWVRYCNSMSICEFCGNASACAASRVLQSKFGYESIPSSCKDCFDSDDVLDVIREKQLMSADSIINCIVFAAMSAKPKQK